MTEAVTTVENEAGQESNSAALKEASLGHRVFVGNLSYQTRDSELKEFCEKAGKVVECRIVYRGPRSMGYGFVAYDSEGEAERAIEKLKNLELDGREVNIEKAVPKGEISSRGRGGAHGRGGRYAGGGYYGGGYGGGSYGGGSYRGRGGFRGSRRGGRRPPREHNGEPSKTTIFVGNLPFNVIDQDLFNIFKDYKITNAHVVRRINGASRGFGFVTVEDEHEQQKALVALSEIWCDDRKLVVRAALSDEAAAKDGPGVVITNAATGSTEAKQA